MIPEFNVKIRQECDTNILKMPEEELMKHDTGLLCNRHYADKRGYSWDQVKEALELERDIVNKADSRSETKDEFEEAVNELADEVADNWMILDDFDVGVAAATMAFSALGGAPVSSCRGHQLNEEPHPYIGGWINREKARLLIEICKECDVGIGNYVWECNVGVLVYSSNIMAMMKLAEALIENAAMFK